MVPPDLESGDAVKERREHFQKLRLAAAGADVGKVIKVIYISRSKYGEAAAHIEEAIKAGKPDILTIDRGGTANNRKAATGA